MKLSFAGVGSVLAMLGILVAMFLTLSARVEHRAISASPMLFRGRPYVMRIHDYDSEKKSIVNANVMVELVQSGSLFATYTVDLIADPWCQSIPKEASMDFEVRSMPMSLVSGTFGPMLNPKLNLSIPENLNLAGRDFCVVISNDRSPSHSLTDAAKANLIARFDIRSRKGQSFRFLYHPENRLVVMAISFVIGFAVVFFPMVAIVDNGKYGGFIDIQSPEPKFNRYERWRRRTRGRAQQKTNLIPSKDGGSQESQSEKGFCESEVTEASGNQVSIVPALPEVDAKDNTNSESVRDDAGKTLQEAKPLLTEQKQLSTEFSLDFKFTEDGSLACDRKGQNLKEIDSGPTQSTAELSDKGPAEADYLMI